MIFSCFLLHFKSNLHLLLFLLPPHFSFHLLLSFSAVVLTSHCLLQSMNFIMQSVCVCVCVCVEEDSVSSLHQTHISKNRRKTNKQNKVAENKSTEETLLNLRLSDVSLRHFTDECFVSRISKIRLFHRQTADQRRNLTKVNVNISWESE